MSYELYIKRFRRALKSMRRYELARDWANAERCVGLALDHFIKAILRARGVKKWGGKCCAGLFASAAQDLWRSLPRKLRVYLQSLSIGIMSLASEQCKLKDDLSYADAKYLLYYTLKEVAELISRLDPALREVCSKLIKILEEEVTPKLLVPGDEELEEERVAQGLMNLFKS